MIEKGSIFCIIGDEAMLMLSFHGSKMLDGAFLPFYEDGSPVEKHAITECITTFLKEKKNTPVYILFDTEGQIITHHKFPKILNGKNLHSAIQSKMKTDFPHGSMTHAFKIQSGANEKSFQMFGIMETDYSRRILLDIIKMPNPICGYASIPVEMGALLSSNLGKDIIPKPLAYSDAAKEDEENDNIDTEHTAPQVIIYHTKLDGIKILTQHHNILHNINTVRHDEDADQKATTEQLIYAVESAMQYCATLEEDTQPQIIVYGIKEIADDIKYHAPEAKLYFIPYEELAKSKLVEIKGDKYSHEQSEDFDIILTSIIARKTIYKPTGLIHNRDFLRLHRVFVSFKITFTAIVGILGTVFLYSGLKFGYIKAFVNDTTYTIQNIASANVPHNLESIKAKHSTYLSHIIFNDKLKYNDGMQTILLDVKKNLPMGVAVRSYAMTCTSNCGTDEPLYELTISCDGTASGNSFDFNSFVSEMKVVFADYDVSISGDSPSFTITIVKTHALGTQDSQLKAGT